MFSTLLALLYSHSLLAYLSDIEVTLVSTNIIVEEGDRVARVCAQITARTTAISVTILLNTEDDSATGS